MAIKKQNSLQWNPHFESLESRVMLRADLVISEFLADNMDGRRDFFDNDSDWFEIHYRGSSRVDLQGWYVTDDLTLPTKWQIPISTVLEPDQRLIIYASGQDVVTETGELHTNFGLNSNGEDLALVDPNGTLVHSFSPKFPDQSSNVSYGIDENVQFTSLISGGATASGLVPRDDSLGNNWTGGNEPFDDSSWTLGTTGIGYETTAVGDTIVAPIAYWTFDELIQGGSMAPDESGMYDGTVVGATLTTGDMGRFGEALSFDGDDDFVNVGVVSELVHPAAFSISVWFQRAVDHSIVEAATNHGVNNVLIGHSAAGSNDTFELGTENGFVELYLDTEDLGGSVAPIREQGSIQNNTWHHLVMTYDRDDPFEVKLYVDGTVVSSLSDWGGLVADSGLSPLSIGISRPGQDSWGEFEGLIDDVAIWDTALDGDQIAALFGGRSPLFLFGYEAYIGLDLETEMYNQNSSALVRMPFTVTDTDSVDMLRLRMQYDDAFVAHVNGQEIARSNFTGPAQWNSVADSDRPDLAALSSEDFFIPVSPGLLHTGDNVLAVQVLNDTSAANRSLAMPQLDVVELLYRDMMLVEAGSASAAFVPDDGALGMDWTGGEEPFDDSGWIRAETGVGYDVLSAAEALNPQQLVTELGAPAPLAYWTFDSLTGEGSVTPDRQGNYAGTVVGATLTTGGNGRFGEALVLDGDNDYVSAGVIPELVNPAAFSVSMWFQRMANHAGTVAETGHGVNNVLIAHSSSTDSDSFEIGTEDNEIEFFLSTEQLGGSTPPIRQQASIENNKWHHLVVTYDSLSPLETKIYVDGALASESSDYGGLVSDSGNSPLTIGLARTNGDRVGDFEGLIDDVAIWDAALEPQHVAALFPVPTPAAYWTFDELTDGDNVVTPDEQGNYDGAVVGAMLTSDGQGRFNEALSFDGDNDSVSAGMVAELVNPSAFSISVWFKRSVDHSGIEASTNHDINNILIAHSSNTSNDTLEIGTEGEFVEFYFDTEELGGSIPPIRESASIENNMWHHLVFTYDSLRIQETKLYMDGVLVNEYSEFGGRVSTSNAPLTIGLSRPGIADFGDFEGLIDDVAFWDGALNAEQVSSLFNDVSPLLSAGPGYATLLGTDLENELYNQNTSTFVRVPFTVADPTAILTLNLDVQYDDAIVVFVNGTEVARSNFTDTPHWNAAADSDRTDTAAFTAERFVIANPTGLLHAGENMLAIQGLNVTTDAKRFLTLPTLSATMLPGELFSFMPTPTPGTVNTEGFVGFAEPPTIGVPGGTFSDPFVVRLNTNLPGSEIRYTTDRSVPTESSLLYTQPVPITVTTQIRAIAVRPGYIPSEIATETYIKLGTDLVNFEGTGLPFGSQLPVAVIDTFRRTISGNNSDASFTLFEPQNGLATITDIATVDSRAAIRTRGASSVNFAKKPYTLEFREDFSDADRSLSLLDLPVESDWVLHGPFNFDRPMNHNRVIFDLSNQIGQNAMRTEYVEMFVNQNGNDLTYSDYAGIYILVEKIKRDPNRVDVEKLSPQMTTEPDITGGYVLQIDRLDPGETGFFAGNHRWKYVEPEESEIQLNSQQQLYIRDYIDDFVAALNNADFTHPTKGQRYSEFVDIDSVIDHHLLNEIALNIDALRLSSYWHKPRNGKLKAGPLWDFDRSMESDDGRDNNPLQWFLDIQRGPTESQIPTFWPRFFDDLEFRQAYIDRWAELRQSEFSDANIQATIDRLISELGPNNPSTNEPDSVTRNFARWPQAKPRTSGGYNTGQLDGTWLGELAHQKAYLATRAAWIDSLFLAAPTFDLESGLIVPPETLNISGPTGTTIYYTNDGTDPRLTGGGISPSAIEYTVPITIGELAFIRARSYDPTYNVPISSFGVPGNNEEAWSGVTEAVFETGSLGITEVNYNPHQPSPGELLINPLFEDGDFEFIEIQNFGQGVFDLEGIRFVDGIEFDFRDSDVTHLDPGQRVLVVRNEDAFEARYGAGLRNMIAGEYSGRLSNMGEQLTLVNRLDQVLQQFSYDDRGVWSTLPDGFGGTLEIIDPSADPNNPNNWRSSTEFAGTPGAAGVGQLEGIVVNEILTNTNPPNEDTIELHNPTSAAIDVSGWWLSDKQDDLDRFILPDLMVIPAGGYLVLGGNQLGFGLDGDIGEDVVLVRPNASGNPDAFIDHVAFGASLTDESFGRWPDEAGLLFPMVSNTFGSTNSGPRIGPVVISEIMYNPPDSELLFDSQLLEFLELYNPTARSVELTGWRIDGMGYDFPGGTTIGPGQVLVLVPFDPMTDSVSRTAFQTVYDVNIATDLSSYLGPYSGRLNNGGETITLQRALAPPDGNPNIAPLAIEDQVSFDELAPWPTEANGTGNSLQRPNVDLWGIDSGNWNTGIPSPGRLGVKKTLAFENSSIVVGEVGQVTNLTHQTQTVNLVHSYNNPVVFAQPASFVGGDPVVVRVSDVQPNQFNLFVAEPSNLNGLHNAGETVSYMVIEAGSHWLADGIHLEVGTVATDATVGAGLTSPTWETVTFHSSFTTTPVVLSQPQTVGDKLFLSTRHETVTANSFQVALEPDEVVAIRMGVETVGYLAIDAGFGTWSGMPFEAGNSAEIFTHFFRRLNFEQTYTAVPNVLASLASYNGIDNSHLRFQNLNLDSIELKIEEDTTLNAETVHTAVENVAYLAIGGPGQLTSTGTAIPDGLTRAFTLDVSESGRVADLDVNIELVHTFIEDLDIFLETPDGAMVELLTDLAADGTRLIATTLDDEADQSITSGNAPFTGRFQPEGLLRNLVGKSITGTWTLHVTDDTAGSQQGALLGWSLDIELASEPEGNLNFDGDVDPDDIDLVFANLGSDDPTFDLDGNGDVDAQDVDHLVLNMIGKRFGDANLDQNVDVFDFSMAVANYDPLGQASFHSWLEGNFDGDGDRDVSDIMRIVLNYAPSGYHSPNEASWSSKPVSVPVQWVKATTTPLPSVSESETAGTNLSAENGPHAEFRPVLDAGRVDNENSSSHEDVLVDDYFRSTRRRNSSTRKWTISQVLR